MEVIYMRRYTVEEVSRLLNKNPETIRRWCRSGKIVAEIRSNKEGYSISEAAIADRINKKNIDIERSIDVTKNNDREGILREALDKLLIEREQLDKAIEMIETLLEEKL
jgi:DNA-binding transcriptional MerR regulator